MLTPSFSYNGSIRLVNFKMLKIDEVPAGPCGLFREKIPMKNHFLLRQVG
jgi:hypothetical protein